MAKGPKVSEYAKRVIVEVYDEHPNWKAEDIKYEANRRLNGRGPGISFVHKFLAKIRKPDEEIDTRPDLPWSLGSSAKYNIPPEANQDLLKIWKWCTIVGMTFTIREAQWVARLRGLVPFEQLYSFAIRFARRERVCLLMGQETVYATDLDMDIVFPQLSRGLTQKDWMISTTRKLTSELHYGNEEISFSDRDIELDYWGKRFFALMMDVPASKVVHLYLAILPTHSHKLSENADIVYTLWLRLLASGGKWKRITEEAKNRIAQQLCDEVALAGKEIYNPTQIDESSKSKGETTSKSENLYRKDIVWMPSEKLLQEVGIPKDPAEWKLVTYESERAGRKL